MDRRIPRDPDPRASEFPASANLREPHRHTPGGSGRDRGPTSASPVRRRHHALAATPSRRYARGRRADIPWAMGRVCPGNRRREWARWSPSMPIILANDAGRGYGRLDTCKWRKGAHLSITLGTRSRKPELVGNITTGINGFVMLMAVVVDALGKVVGIHRNLYHVQVMAVCVQDEESHPRSFRPHED